MVHTLPADYDGVKQGVDLIKTFLNDKGIRGEENHRMLLMAEESMRDMLTHAEPDSPILLSLRSVLGTIVVEISMKGEEYRFGESVTPDAENAWAEPGSATEATLRSMVLNAYLNNLKYSHKNGINKVRMVVGRSMRSVLWTVLAIASAILLSLILSLITPPEFRNALNEDVLNTVKTIYMNALKIIAAPVVFFSIASSVSQLSNLSQLGRIGIKVICLYLITTVIAVIIGIGMTCLLRPGDPSLAANAIASGAKVTAQSLSTPSLKDMIIGIVPDNLLKPFLESQMLQLIFVAVISGIAVGMIGEYSKGLRILFEALNQLFLKITSIFMRVTNFVVFCSVLSLCLTLGASSLVSLLGMVGTFLLCILCMMLVYSLILLISGVNPLKFYKSYAPVMLQVFSIGSSNAAIPLNMDYCKNKMKISPKVYSFSIPLGATINMDGTCILLAVQALTLARVFGVDIPGNMLVSLGISIIALSIGAPGVPGSGVIMLSMLMNLLGIPMEAITIIMGLSPLLGMFLCMSNCLGDVSVTTSVAKHENLIEAGSDVPGAKPDSGS